MTADRQPLIECEHCASIYRRHQLEPDETANCARCGATLWRYSGLSLSNWLALAIAALIVFGVANAYPVASMSVQGMTQQASLLDAISITWRQGHWVVAVMTGLAGFALPLLQLGVLLWVLGPLSRGREPLAFRPAMRLLGILRPWCMVPVFLLGVLVAVVKLAGMAAVSPGIGLGAFGILTILLTMLGRLSPHALWRYAEDTGVVPVHVPQAGPDRVLTGCHVCGQVQALPREADPEALHHCVRCDALVHHRKPDHLARTWALLLAAIVFYIPANVLPVMKVSSVLGDSAHTILGGVVELWEMGSWDIALIVFIASVVVPLTKLLAIILLLLTEQWRSTTNLRPRTRLYQMVEFIGQWSMLDVFVVILLAALADFQGLMEISAGAGAAAFGVVVILTMLSAMSFDLRRSWDLETQSEIESAPVESRRRPTTGAGQETG
ncbi:paraquat-inducible membrane protein A [Achromobacter pulmonis]|uniref:Paraquat-inducible membrane protein A n=1 Tax=Achromobacter pulmonis TaxID=1389932 RepID=A0A2N8KKV3_9BURK|nr:PqiA/YebS family transporter subunit [Achromobacter pulmonis]PND34089.1 paraquat-inducible membrane protein A [Achromobacter pulmonis]